MSRVVAYPSAEERQEIARRAALHGTSRSKYLVAAATGQPVGVAGEADQWWASLRPERRAQLHRWVTSGRGTQTPPEDLVPLPFDHPQEAP